jgi:tRNA-dihydrouridine synthase B
MIAIGSVRLKNPVIAAPMAGVTDKASRIIAKSFNCGMVSSEMISDLGLVYGQAKTLRMIELHDETAPICIQIFGSKVEDLVRAAAIVEQSGCSIIDINMGCPAPKVVKSGEGAALMLDLPKSRAIIRGVVKAVSIPVTVKMRKGWDEQHIACFELAEIAEQEGAQAVTIHPRTRQQFFAGQADWQVIEKIKSRLSIPVIGNGDIWEARDAADMIKLTGCDAVMVGRGALGNPFIFREIAALLKDGKIPAPPTIEERLLVARLHLELACHYKGEYVGVREMRKHLAWYMKGMRGAARLREEINHCDNLDAMLKILHRLNLQQTPIESNS